MGHMNFLFQSLALNFRRLTKKGGLFGVIYLPKVHNVGVSLPSWITEAYISLVYLFKHNRLKFSLRDVIVTQAQLDSLGSP